MNASESTNNQAKVSLNKRLAAIGSRFRTAKGGFPSRPESELSRINLTSVSISLPAMPLPTTESGAAVSLLYGCTKYRSLDEFQAIVHRFPGCLKSTNQLGQTPLHVAASKGVRSEIVLFLLLSFPEASRMVDDYSKLPLHYAAKSSKWMIQPGSDFFCDERDEVATRDPDYCLLLKQMCQAHPSAATHEDRDGLNPIELALTDVSPDFTIVRFLQRTASRHWKEWKITQAAVIAQTPITQKERRLVAGCSA